MPPRIVEQKDVTSVIKAMLDRISIIESSIQHRVLPSGYSYYVNNTNQLVIKRSSDNAEQVVF